MEEPDPGTNRNKGIRKGFRKEEPVKEGKMQNGGGKSVFGRWLKDFRSGQNREPKPHRPLGRTLSANVKVKDRKKKISRTLSANQKDRKKEGRLEGKDEKDWDSDIFLTRNYNSYGVEELNYNWYLEGCVWTRHRDRDRDRDRDGSFSSSSPEGLEGLEGPEINRTALVSYLDEEGLRKTEETEGKQTANKRYQEEVYSREESIRSRAANAWRDFANESSHSLEKTRNGPMQDGPIMPASSLQKKTTTTTGSNYYENHESLLLNEKNKGSLDKPQDYLQIEYSEKERFSYCSGHRYENLETTDYISWSSERSEKDCEVNKSDEELGKPRAEKCSGAVVECGFRFGYGVGDWRGGQDEPEAPARDPSSLKSIKYGPGHEKYPSWPGSVRPETGDKPQRSHSWTEQTNYPKEKVTSYVRPLNKRTNPAFTQQLKTVMERCEKISPDTYQKTMEQVEEREKRLYLPRVDREGKSIGDQDYLVPSPPERDKPTLTQADLEKYYQDNHLTKIDNGDYSTPYEDIRKAPPLTQADLEEYARSYDDVLKPHHQHQGSYAQSEGYHSYVSSSELTTTPFLDRLRRDSAQHWNEEDGRAGRDSVVTTSSGSASSSETLKWHGSMSDVSVASSSCRSRQLIAHSSRVPPAQRHHSESVLYLGNQSSGGSNWQGKDRSHQLKLFPVNTYTVQPNNEQNKSVISPTSVPKMSVAERISELERQQQAQRFAYYDPEKRHKISDPTLKAIQKKALLSFYERHQQHTMGHSGPPKDNWKSSNSAPPPPPRPASSRRASCASDLSIGSRGRSDQAYACDLVGPVIVGPSISIDDWVPELPPKKPHLRSIPPPLPHRTPSPVQVPPTESEPESIVFQKTLSSYERMPTPDLPPPPPPPEGETVASDEPLPPPPPEVEWHLATAVPRRTSSSGRASPRSPSPHQGNSAHEPAEGGRAPIVPDAYEIQYDQDAINAILESNRMAEMQRKKYSKSKHKDHEAKNHIENRPPLPLPRDVVTEKKQFGCEKGTLQNTKENLEGKFIRNISKSENASRGSMKVPKNETNIRSSLRYPPKKLITNGTVNEQFGAESCKAGPQKPLGKCKSGAEHAKPFSVKKVSEYQCRIPNRDKDSLSVFETTAIDDSKQEGSLQSTNGSNSRAAFLALRREKELGMTNCEGSYKLTVSQSGETIDTTNSEKSPLEIVKMKEKSGENLVLDNRLTLEPPDLIPKITNLNRKSSSVHDVRDNRKKYDYNRLNDKYRLIQTNTATNNINNRVGMFEDNIIENECRVNFSPQTESRAKDSFESERPPVATVECVRAVITKLECEAPERLEPKEEEANGGEKYGVSFGLSRAEPEKEKPPTLLRVHSNVEKRVNRSDSMKSAEGKVERSKCLKLVERSTSFGRTDTMRVVEVSEGADTRNLNLSVSDASSQTESPEEEPSGERDEEAQRKMEEEMEYERLSRDLASHLSPSDKLQSLLVPDSERKKPTDYVAGLFRLELSSKPRKLSPKKEKPSGVIESSCDDSSPREVVVNGVTSNQHERTEETLSGFSVVSVTDSKSKSPTKHQENCSEDSRQLQKKKEELMARLGRKLSVLKEEREALTNECTVNEDLGTSVANCVAKSARPHELAKYRLHVEEVGKITSLLLGLSGRLAKVENALLGLPSHHNDRKLHESKRDKLQEQLAEAKQLKENIDRRSDSVAKTLGKHLNAEEYADYVHFIRMKAKLIVELREIAEKISFGEEQLAALKETS